MAKPGRWALTVLVAALALTNCAGKSMHAGSAVSITPADRLYVSIGDSYAAGYRPMASGPGSTTTDGFAYQIAARGRIAGKSLKLVNFGCSGVTSTQLREESGCAAAALGPDAPDYPGRSQADAATAFVAAHRSQLALITVIIGGNDIKPCVQESDGSPRPDAMSCLTAAGEVLKTNLTAVLSGIRAAAGSAVPIVGLTYPDMYLGAWVATTPGARDLATASVKLFRDLLNPMLKTEYGDAGMSFADITAATGGYGPLSDVVTDPQYGTIPKPVARVCALTYYCQFGDVHPTVGGHLVIADQVLALAHAS
ncbi:GDSL-type esterase/lipase family protein [Amycolatopsis sp. H20-H5]|uniref:GDSL-type esterase/lipase family protein n=1 Tax=Amycolatopsis sp. H20-H5 TaxID=3046309 RepID=UPI002DB727DA|nr:GDSL-type esterase/lipase family protein [Amycolatopsis sp. H20-H5]